MPSRVKFPSASSPTSALPRTAEERVSLKLSTLIDITAGASAKLHTSKIEIFVFLFLMLGENRSLTLKKKNLRLNQTAFLKFTKLLLQLFSDKDFKS